MANIYKQKKVEELQSIIKNIQNFILIKYGSVPHARLEQLRKELKKLEAELKVVKNSLFEKAVNKLAIEDKKLRLFSRKVFPLKENTAIVGNGKDIYEAIKAVFNFAKENEDLEFKGGFIDETAYDKQEVDKLARLPSRQELLGKIYLSIKSPLSRITYAVKFNHTKLYLIIKELAKKNK